MKVLYCSSEVYPFAVSGGLGDVAGSLPKALRKRKIACRVVLPLYEKVPQEYRDKMKFLCNFNVSLGWREQYCGVFQLTVDGVVHYFIDNEYYFKRGGLYGHFDDGERFAFFSKAVLEMLQYIDFEPDIIHTNDWQTALVGVYLNAFYRGIPKCAGIKNVFTIHNAQYQGQYDLGILGEVLGLPAEYGAVLEYQGDVNFMKGGIVSADKVTTVSPTYANELQTPWFGYGMSPVLSANASKLSGIVNGLDYAQYDPELDANIIQNYTDATADVGKAACKAALQEEFGLAQDPDAFIIGIVSRMVSHKGFDLICHKAQELLNAGVQLVVLGQGEGHYEGTLKAVAGNNPGRFGLRLGFLEDVAHRIYAGADAFLMPSHSEPCGLSQMIAMRYGTLPIVHQTGGLADTVVDVGDGGVGFTFKSFNADDMFGACMRAKGSFVSEDWPLLRQRAMNIDNSWGYRAKEYIYLYEQTMQLW